MNLKQRIERLELLHQGDEDEPEIVFIYMQDARKRAASEPDPFQAVVVGKVGGKPGFTLTRTDDEIADDFITRVEAAAAAHHDNQNSKR